MDPTTRAEEMLKQVWNNNFGDWPWDRAFVVDKSLPELIVENPFLTPEEMTAVLGYWRNKMVASIDEVVQRYQLQAITVKADPTRL
jgi:hypothetical protein